MTVWQIRLQGKGTCRTASLAHDLQEKVVGALLYPGAKFELYDTFPLQGDGHIQEHQPPQSDLHLVCCIQSHRTQALCCAYEQCKEV